MSDDGEMIREGFRKVKPLTEGYVVKGGRNTSSKITTRPPAPALLKPHGAGAAQASDSTPIER